jgi:chemotaxis protein methyltransferase CheR
LTLTDEEVQILCRIAYDEAGLVFDESRRDVIQNRIARRLQELPGVTPSAYVNRLRFERGEELHRFLDLLTVNETYFFRDLPQLQLFADHVLPSLIAAKSGRSFHSRLRIWSAGCSVGCEPFTLAMLITEELERSRASVDWEVIATDISASVLQVAQAALYTDREIKDVPEPLRGKYFVRNGEYWEFSHPSRRRVHIQYANLLRAEESVRGPFDAIFCRNVMIYFDDAVRRRVADAFYELLVPGGYIFLGFSESMSRISRAFELRRIGPGLVYVKA